MFTLQANQVSDINGNTAAPVVLGTLQVNFSDKTAPTAALNFPVGLVNLSSSYDFTVTYSDDTAVKSATLGNQNIRVTGPSAFNQLATLVSLNASGNASALTATYRLAAPGGSWDDADNGTYSFTLVGQQVSDTLGQFAPTQLLGTLPIVLADVTPPTVTLNALAAPVDASSNYNFTVTYADANGIDSTSLNGSNILVTGPNGFSQLATFISVANPVSGGQRTATYQITAPGGTWNNADNGSYAFALVADQVRDIPGNSALAKALGTLKVSLVDTTPPTAVLGIAPSPIAGTTTYGFTVTYSDLDAINGDNLRWSRYLW